MNKGVSFLETGIHNTSEIGRLKKVLLHRPGGELENLMPEYLERLLFDDIPYLKEAQREHDAFADCLRQQGVEVVYLRDLVAESITDADVRADLIRQFLEESGVKDDRLRESLEDFLSALPDKEMVSAMMAGVRKSQLRANSARLGDYLSAQPLFYPGPLRHHRYRRVHPQNAHRHEKPGDPVRQVHFRAPPGLPQRPQVVRPGRDLLPGGGRYPDPVPSGAGGGHLSADGGGLHRRLGGDGALREQDLPQAAGL